MTQYFQDLYVARTGSDFYGDGKSWETAWQTPQKALQELAAYPANINVGPGEYIGTLTYSGEGQNFRGDRRFIYGTHFRAPSPTANVVEGEYSQCGMFDAQVDGSGPSWTGVALYLRHALFFNAERFILRNSTGWATETTGGTGIYAEAMEECTFKNLQFSEFNKAIDLGVGATGLVFENLHMDTCWQDLVINPADNSSGGHTFNKMKGVGTKSQNPVLIAGGGQNVFIAIDFEESGGQVGNKVIIRSNHNTFIGGGVSPQSEWIVDGDQCLFENMKILRKMILNGNRNMVVLPELIGGLPDGELTFNGKYNVLDTPRHRSGVIKSNDATNVLINKNDAPITGTWTELGTGGGGTGGTGPAGPAPVLQVGNVTTVAAGGQASAGVRKVADPATYALDFGLVKGDTGQTGTPGTPGSGGGAAAGVGQSRSQSIVMNDPLTPVVADGIGFGVGQGQNAAASRSFLIMGQPRGVEGTLGSDQMVGYPGNAGVLMKASPAVFLPGWGIWTPTSGAADQDKIYGMPGVAVWSSRIDYGGRKRRLTQRWYHVPGYPDALFCELMLTIDPTSTDGAATGFPTAGSDISPYLPRFSLQFETKAGFGGQALAADSALGGIPFVSVYPSASGVDPVFYFARCLTEPVSGFHYEDAATADAAQNFASGALPGTNSYTTTQGRIFRAKLAVTTQQGLPMVFCTRFVVAAGHSLEAAKNVAAKAPNQGVEATIEHYESKVAATPAPANLAPDEAKAWGRFALTTILNTRTERDYNPERGGAHWDGQRRQLTWAGIGRWDAVWQFDTAIGIAGYSTINPELVKSVLDYLLNSCMKSDGFLRRDPTVTTETSVGNFYLARLARRYLAATGDRTFLAALYPRLKLLYQWWTAVANGTYRHPNWPTVRLLTASKDVEVQEVSPVTSGGNYPSGDDWATAIAYDFAVHMAYLAGQFASADVGFWNAEAAAYKAAIRQYCWDPGQGWFQPTMKAGSPSGGQADNLGRFQAVRTYRAFWHLWAGTATPAQAATMKSQIMDPNIFLGNFGVRTVDKRWASYQPDNWVNGGSRAYFDACVSTGLRRYGFNADSDTVLQRWVDRQNAVGTTPESVNPDTGAGGFARFLLAGVAVTESLLAKRAPGMLGVDSGSAAIGLEPVTS